MMKKRFRQWMVYLPLISMLLLEGCTGRGGADPDSGPESPLETADAGGDRETGMGRYLEQEIRLPDEVASRSSYPRAYLQQLDNGELALMEQAAGRYLFSDQGETWIKKPIPWYDDLDAYVSDIALAPNGDVAVIY